MYTRVAYNEKLRFHGRERASLSINTLSFLCKTHRKLKYTCNDLPQYVYRKRFEFCVDTQKLQ